MIRQIYLGSLIAVILLSNNLWPGTNFTVQDTSMVSAQPESQNKQSTFTLLSILSLVVGAIGVIGTVYTVISWRSAQKDRKIYQYLFEAAEKNIDKDITEKQLSTKREQVNQISDHIEKLQEQIRRDIPIEARRTVLKDKLNSQIELLVQSYNSMRSIEKELDVLPDSPEIPDEILEAIHNEISPEYLLKEERSRLKNYITIITTSAAILSTVLPRPLGTWISIPFLLIAIPMVYKLFKSYMPNEVTARKQYLYRLYYSISFITVLATTVIGLLFLATWIDRPRQIYMIYFMIVLAIALLSLLIGFIYFFKHKRIRAVAS